MCQVHWWSFVWPSGYWSPRFWFMFLQYNPQEGDRIVLITQVNDEWFRGSIASSEGMFPASFVRIDVPIERKSELAAPTCSAYQAVALYTFDAETSHDLSLQVTLFMHSFKFSWFIFCLVTFPICYWFHSQRVGRRHCPSNWIGWQRLALWRRLSDRSARSIPWIFCQTRLLSQK